MVNKSLELYREALQAFNGYVYPLSSWKAKYAPPKGLTGKDCKSISSWMLEDKDTFAECIEAISLDVGKSPEDAKKEGQHWSRVLWDSDNFAFCGYPPEGLLALDIDHPELLNEVERALGLHDNQLVELLSTCPAVINSDTRTLKAHHYLRYVDEQRELLGRMMSMQVPGGHLGDLIAKPEGGFGHKPNGGKYQKLHGGHERSSDALYRLVDATGDVVGYNTIHEAPELPVWLHNALVAKFGVGSSQTLEPTVSDVEPVVEETAVMKANRLFNEAYSPEDQLALVDEHLPECCKWIPTTNGEHRIMSTSQETKIAGAVVNINETGSNIFFHSPNVKKAFLGTTSGSDTLRLSTIATLPRTQWSVSANHVGQVIHELELRLGIKQPKELGNSPVLLERQPEPTDSLTPLQVKALFTCKRMTDLLRRHNLEFNTDKEDPYAPLSNSSIVVRVLIATMANKDCYVQNNTVRAKGEVYDGDDREVALAHVLQSPRLVKLVLENWVLFQTEGWKEITNSAMASKQGTQVFTSEMAAYGFYDIHTGHGGHNTCLQDKITGDIYTPDKKSIRLTRIINGGEAFMSKSKTNHAYFNKLNADDTYYIEQTVEDAKMILSSIIRLAEQHGPIMFDAESGTYTDNPDYEGSYLPDPQSRAAVLLAFLSDAVTGRSTTWLHLDGQDSTATGKSTFMEIARRVVPGAVKAKLVNTFGSKNDYDKQCLIGKRFVIDDEVSYITGDMVNGLKELITNGVAARRIYGRTMYHTKPMSIVTATNSKLVFHGADGVEASIARRFVRLPCLPIKDKGHVDMDYLERIPDTAWEAFMSILVQPELFGLEPACKALKLASSGAEVEHEALAELKKLAKTDSVLKTPVDDWLRVAIVPSERSSYIIRSDIFKMMQLEPDVPVEPNNGMNMGIGAKAMQRLETHVKNLGGSPNVTRSTTDKFGKRRRIQVHYGVDCIYELDFDNVVIK